jgi:hypothetical protein
MAGTCTLGQAMARSSGWTYPNALAATELVPAGDAVDLQTAGNGKVGVLTCANSTHLWSADTGQTRDLGRPFYSARWLPDDRRVVTFHQGFAPYRVYDTQRDEWLGTLYPQLTGEQYVCIGPDGHWRGSEQAAEHLVYVALTEDGRQETYAPADCRKKFGWQNDPAKVIFLGPSAEPALPANTMPPAPTARTATKAPTAARKPNSQPSPSATSKP